MGLVAGHPVGALAGHLDLEPGRDHLGLELVAQRQGQAERVEARAQVGRGRRDGDPHRASTKVVMPTSGEPGGGRGRGHVGVDHRVDDRAPALGEPSSAVAVSLRPWPVTVTTTVLPRTTSPPASSGEQPGDPGGRGRLDEDAVARGELALRGQDLVVADRARTRPPDSSRAASASFHEAGLPIRIAVARVSGSGNGSPVTSGAAPSAWKPRITGACWPCRRSRTACSRASTPRCCRRCRPAAGGSRARRRGSRRSRRRRSSGPRAAPG